MPTRKITTETIEDASETPEIIEVDELEEAAETALDGMLAEFSGADDVTVNVYRQGEGKNIRFLFKTMPEDMNGGDVMERCRDQFGTGDYRLHVRKGSRILANRSFSVEAPKEVAPTAPRDSNADIIALIQGQNAQMSQMFLGAMTAMAEAFKGGNTNAPLPVDPIAQQTAIIAGIAQMKEISDSGKTNEPGGVEMLMKGIKLAADLQPKTGETNMNDIFLKAVEAFPALAAMTPKQAPSPGTRPLPVQGPVNAGQPSKITQQSTSAQPSPDPAPNTVPVNDTEKEREAMFIAQMRANLQWLCRLAQDDKNPELYAEVVLDQMGTEKVLEFIGHETALEEMAKIEPAVTLYRGWFNRLKEAIIELTSDEKEAVAETEGEYLAADESPSPATVVARIDESGLRREGRKGASITIPESGEAIPDGGSREPSSDTARP